MSHNIQDDMGKATRRRRLPKRRHSRIPGKRCQQRGGAGETHVVFDFDCTLTSRHFARSLNSQKYLLETLQNNLKNEVVPDEDPVLVPNKNYYKLNKNIREVCEVIVTLLTPLTYANQRAPYQNLIKNRIINLFFGGQVRFQKLTDLLTVLQENSVILHIASRGNRKALLSILRFIGWTVFFPEERVNAKYDVSHPYENKNLYIKNILDQSNTVYYFDDDSEEHKELITNYVLDDPPTDDLFNTFKSRANVIIPYFFFKGLGKELTGISIEQANQLIPYFQNIFRGPAARPSVPPLRLDPALHDAPPDAPGTPAPRSPAPHSSVPGTPVPGSPAPAVNNPAMCGTLTTIKTYSNSLDKKFEPMDASAPLRQVRLLGLLADNPTVTMDHVNVYSSLFNNTVKYEPFSKAHESDPDIKTLQIETVVNKFRMVAPFTSYFYGLLDDAVSTNRTAVVCLNYLVVKALIQGITGEELPVTLCDVVQLDIDYNQAQPKDRIQVRHLKSTKKYNCSSPNDDEPSGEGKFKVYLFVVYSNFCKGNLSEIQQFGQAVMHYMNLFKTKISADALFYSSLDPVAILMATMFVNIFHREAKDSEEEEEETPVATPTSRLGAAPNFTAIDNIQCQRYEDPDAVFDEDFCQGIRGIDTSVQVENKLKVLYEALHIGRHYHSIPDILLLDYCSEILKPIIKGTNIGTGFDFASNPEINQPTLDAIEEALRVTVDVSNFDTEQNKKVPKSLILRRPKPENAVYRSRNNPVQNPQEFMNRLLHKDKIRDFLQNRVYACITTHSTFVKELIKLFNNSPKSSSPFSLPANPDGHKKNDTFFANLDVLQINLLFDEDPLNKDLVQFELLHRPNKNGYQTFRNDRLTNFSYKIFLMRHCIGCHNILGRADKVGPKMKKIKHVGKVLAFQKGYNTYAMCVKENVPCLVANRENLLNMFNTECDSLDNIRFCSSIVFRAIVTAALLIQVLFNVKDGKYNLEFYTTKPFNIKNNIYKNIVMTKENRLNFLKLGKLPYLLTRSVESPNEYGLTTRRGKNYKIKTIGPHNYAFEGHENITAPTLEWLIQTFHNSIPL
jgi:hypothetical protein